MFRTVFGSRRRGDAAAAARAPSPVYAIGDVHGRADALEPLLAELRTDLDALGEPATLVFLGDMIDRGPDSARVLDMILDLRTEPAWAAVETLKGNHEDAMLLFLEDSSFGPSWVQHGGGATLASYGVLCPPSTADAMAWEASRLALIKAVPPDHLQLLQSLKLSLAWGDYLFVHAGVRPGVPLALQDPRDLLWIRQDFLSARQALENIVVVHGHTPADAPELTEWRIGVDTGAYATGLLTAVRLKGADRRIFQARASRR